MNFGGVLLFEKRSFLQFCAGLFVLVYILKFATIKILKKNFHDILKSF